MGATARFQRPAGPHEETGVSDEALLPEGWEKVSNPQGEIWYYNSVENRTTWARPRATEKSSVWKLAGVSAEAPLPEGWEKVSNNQGEIWYYNLAEDRSIWERPGRRSKHERLL